jgi:integrase
VGPVKYKVKERKVLENKEIEGPSSSTQVIIERRTLDPWTLYLYSMKSPATKEKYLMRLGKFLDFLNIQEGGALEDKSRIFAKKGRDDNIWAFNGILSFIQLLKERVDRKEITAGTIRNYVKSIRLFCQMADISIPWDKITRGIPRGRRYADDRAPTLDEIKKMCEYPDRRIKPVIYTMVSSGIRVGAWDYLHWGNIQPIEQESKIVAARMIVYADEDDSYITYITPSAYRELAEWMKYREESGEIITENSWVMRDLWDTRVKISKGLITIPKKLTAIGVKRLMERAIWAQGLRKKLEAGKKRHPFPTNHSLRKYFKTRCELAGMKPINIENLMGHSTGISDSYYRPTENDLLQDYLKCVDALTISDEKSLQKKVEDLANKSEDNKYLVNAKLSEKEKQIEVLIRKQEQFEVLIQSLIDSGQLKPTS